MWLPSFNAIGGARALRALALAVALGAGLAVSACTLTPVYGDAAAAQQALELRHAAPNDRLEQVFYRALALRVPSGSADTVPEVSVSVSASTSRIGLTTIASPVRDHQVVARAAYTVTRDGETIASGTHTATAGYQTTGQLVADNQARDAAIERAVQQAAQSVRLELLGRLGTP
ncbi:hypothetical protein [Pelagibacterium lacus]|uniref:LPS-assembly lipoprotein n=1 Tax=Pelagibacterium lacus TaxID=2282655 RepID=A0A369W394_9HYPH|nr:hypothetical protein [Pelagibacterium lacus]RDE08519.1 hypothetical protein DVH29_10925 [Pelagibacterium lacus]